MAENTPVPFEMITLRSGNTHRGLRMPDSGVVLVLPDHVEPDQLGNEYERLTIQALNNPGVVSAVIDAIGERVQFLLPIKDLGDGRFWRAPGSCQETPAGDMAFYLHYGPA